MVIGGQANTNVGIGLTNPASALQVNGTITATAFSGAVAGASSLNVLKTGDTMSGALALPSNGLVAGTNQLVISGGNVGIGTTTPQNKLQVAGNITVGTQAGTTDDNADYSITSNGQLHIQANQSGVADSAYVYLTLEAGTATSGPNNSGILMYTAGTEKMRVSSGGNVGIGTATPSHIFHVSSGVDYPMEVDLTTRGGSFNHLFDAIMTAPASAGDNIALEIGTAKSSNNTAYFGLYNVAAGSTSNFATIGLYNKDNILNVTGAGNVGIGTTIPNSILTVAGATAAGSYLPALNLINTAYNNNGPGGVDLNFINEAVNMNVGAKLRMIRVGSYDQADLAFFTSNTGSGGDVSTEKMRITSAGRVGIGSSTPGVALDVNGAMRATSVAGANKTSFSAVASYDIPIDLTNNQRVEIVLDQWYAGTASVNASIQFNTGGGSSNFSEYGVVFTKNTALTTPVSDNTNILFNNIETIASGIHDSHATIKVYKSLVSGGRNSIEIRGSYCWASIGQTRVDATGYTFTVPTYIHVSVPAGTTMTGTYTVVNLQ
jgi:hypothetical protein